MIRAMIFDLDGTLVQTEKLKALSMILRLRYDSFLVMAASRQESTHLKTSWSSTFFLSTAIRD